jgi:uncharacterized protein YcfL
MTFHFKLYELAKFAGLIVIGLSSAMTSMTQAQQPVTAQIIAKSTGENQLTFEYLFFWKDDDAQTKSVLDATQQELAKFGDNVSLRPIGIRNRPTPKR